MCVLEITGDNEFLSATQLEWLPISFCIITSNLVSGSIRKSADGRWEGLYSSGYDPKTGKRIRKSVYGKTQKEVRKSCPKSQRKWIMAHLQSRPKCGHGCGQTGFSPETSYYSATEGGFDGLLCGAKQ